MMLADLGADVIKIEQPGSGDGTRQWGPPWYDAGDERQSAYYLSVNRNKRSVALNLKTAAGRDLARQLAARSQVVVENFTPGQMVRLRFGLRGVARHPSRAGLLQHHRVRTVRPLP